MSQPRPLVQYARRRGGRATAHSWRLGRPRCCLLPAAAPPKRQPAGACLVQHRHAGAALGQVEAAHGAGGACGEGGARRRRVQGSGRRRSCGEGPPPGLHAMHDAMRRWSASGHDHIRRNECGGNGSAGGSATAAAAAGCPALTRAHDHGVIGVLGQGAGGVGARQGLGLPAGRRRFKHGGWWRAHVRPGGWDRCQHCLGPCQQPPLASMRGAAAGRRPRPQ